MSRRAPLKPPVRHHIEMAPVKSEAIKAIGHHPESNTLRVTFHNGVSYEYPGVTAEEHQAFVGAESIGRHFLAKVRHLPYRKLEREAA